MPYAPQAQFDPNLILAVGQNISRPIGQALQTGVENYVQTHKEGKAADALREAMKGPEDDNGVPQNPNPFGISDDQWKTMGARDRAASAMGWTKATALQQAMAETQHVQAEDQANQFYANLGGSLSKQLDQVPTDQLTGEPMTADPSLAAVKASITPQQQMLLRAVGQAGPGNRGAAAAVAPIVKAMLTGTGDAAQPAFTTDTQSVPGWALTGMKGSKQWQALPTGSAKVQMVDDGQGGQVPVIQSPKGNVTQIKPEGAITPQDQFKFATESNRDRLKMAQEALNDPLVSGNPDALAGAKAELEAARQERAQLLAQHPGLKAKGGPTAKPAANAIPPEHIRYLQAHPEAAASFDQKYGAGASDQYLP